MPRHSPTPVEELIRACAESHDAEAWQEFVERFDRPIRLSVLRVANHCGRIPSQVIDDLVQETYLKLCADHCRLLLAFVRQTPEFVVGYIRKTAIRVVLDHFKAEYSQKRGAGETDQWVDNAEPSALSAGHGGQCDVEREIILQEINRCVEDCTAGPEQERDRLIFWLRHQQGFSAKAIAALPGVGLTESGVESAIARITRDVVERVAGSALRAPESPPGKGFRPATSY